MVDYKRITEALIQSVGLRQTQDTQYNKLNSNVVFDGIKKVLIKHPLITIENIFECAKQFGDFVFPEYSAAQVYTNEDPYSNRVIGSDEKIYEYINATPSAGNDPVADVTGTYWEVVNLESLFVEDVFKNAAYEVVSEVINRKASRYETKSLLQYQKIYDGLGKISDKITAEGSLVGFEIIPKRNENISVIINQLGTHFDAATDIDFLLFHSSQLDPIKTFTLSHGKVSGFQWNNVEDQNLNLKYYDGLNDSGGSFFLLYDQDQPAAQAINKNYDYYKSCSYCSQYDNFARSSRKDFYLIRSIEVLSADRVQDGGSNEQLFDISKVKETNLKTWGLNLSVQANCDLTDLLIDQKQDIAKVLSTKIIIDLLSEMQFSTRQNQIKEATKKQAAFALQDKVVGGHGLLTRYEKEIDALDFNLSNLNTRCLPKKKAGKGIRTATNNLYR